MASAHSDCGQVVLARVGMQGLEERMSARIKGGIAGWIAGTLPLAAVNVADIVGIFSFDEAVLAGALALGAGILLGGIMAGSFGGRPRDGQPGGASAAASSGLLAAGLFAVSVIVLLVGTAIHDSDQLGVVDIIRLALTVIFVAALLLLVCLLTGAIVGRLATRRPAAPLQPARYPAAPSAPRPGTSVGNGMGISRSVSRPAGASRPVSHPVSPAAPRRPQMTDPRRVAEWQDEPYPPPDDRYAPSVRPYTQPSRPDRRPSGPSGSR
jgi:hypothetical protein